jgi:hypothetical protein
MDMPVILGNPSNKTPELVLFVTTPMTGSDKGWVYQVNSEEDGRVMGKVSTPYPATGICLHRDNSVVLALPRDGGRIMQINEAGKLSTILEKSPQLPHPVDVALAGSSDTIVVADNIANVVAATSIGGTIPKVYQRFDDSKYTSQDMSVAVSGDKQVIFSSAASPGVFRFAGDQNEKGNKPALPTSGCVAADPNSTRWAAAQEPNLIFVYDGSELIKKFRLPPDKAFYKNGLMSFSPAGSLCVAVRDTDKEVGEVWFLCYDIDKDKDGVRSLFKWKYEEILDFTSGPRMPWNRHAPSDYKSTL